MKEAKKEKLLRESSREKDTQVKPCERVDEIGRKESRGEHG